MKTSYGAAQKTFTSLQNMQQMCSKIEEEDVNRFFSTLVRRNQTEGPCVGCIQKVSSSLRELNLSKCSTQNVVETNLEEFMSVSMFLPYLCAILNCGGGYIFVYEAEKALKGYSLSQEKKTQCRSHVKDCLSYISPKAAQFSEVTQTQFIPIIPEGEEGTQLKQTQCIIRIRINPSSILKSIGSNQLFYIDYQGGSGGKKTVSLIYKFNFQTKTVEEIFSHKIYQEIQASIFQYKANNEVDRYHEGESCKVPLDFSHSLQKQHNSDKPTKEDFENFENSTYFAFPTAQSGEAFMKKIKKILLEEKIIFKSVRLFEESFKHKKNQQKDLWIIFHEETTQTIKKLLTSQIKANVHQKTSNVLKARDQVEVIKLDLEILDSYNKQKFPNAGKKYPIYQICHTENGTFLKFKKKIYALFALCVFQSIGRRYLMVQPQALSKKKIN